MFLLLKVKIVLPRAEDQVFGVFVALEFTIKRILIEGFWIPSFDGFSDWFFFSATLASEFGPYAKVIV